MCYVYAVLTINVYRGLLRELCSVVHLLWGSWVAYSCSSMMDLELEPIAAHICNFKAASSLNLQLFALCFLSFIYDA